MHKLEITDIVKTVSLSKITVGCQYHNILFPVSIRLSLPYMPVYKSHSSL